MRKIRLYGEVGRGSFAQVTSGVLRALQYHGLLDGFVSSKGFQESDDVPGANAPIAVICGSPGNIDLSHSAGCHEERWFMLAPNSEGVWEKLVKELLKPSRFNPANRTIDGILATSHWAKQVMDVSFGGKLPIVACPHGVGPQFVPNDPMRAMVEQQYIDGRFHVLHITSTDKRRKATMELIKAWAQLCEKERTWRENARLVILAHPLSCEQYRVMVRKAGLSGQQCHIDLGLGFTEEAFIGLYSACHLLAQPSRAEGYGLCCVESLACGVPVLATDCTGHSEWALHAPGGDIDAEFLRPGVVLCNSFDLHEESDDYPGATCPSVTVDDVIDSLEQAREEWPSLNEAARDNADDLRAELAWEKTSGPPLQKLATRESM
jgi:glycosyltransferase involved in cell wall biosynthesis